MVQVHEERREAFERAFLDRESHVHKAEGFVGFELLRREGEAPASTSCSAAGRATRRSRAGSTATSSIFAAALLAIAALAVPAAAQAAPERIVALTPFGANTLVKLGVEPVGIGQTLGGQERFSPKLKDVETLPLSHPNGPNLEQLASVAQARKGIEERPTVMLILGVGRTPFTFLPNSWGGDLVTKAGGKLLTGGVESSSGFERISDEVVVAEDPDVIVRGGQGP